MKKEDIEKELQGIKGIKIIFKEVSPYMKARYKPEYWEAEAWIYTPTTTVGYCITTEDYSNIEYRKNFFDMIREESGMEETANA